MGSWLDPVIAGWLVLAAAVGFRSGAFRAGARIVGLVAGIWAAVVFRVPVAALLDDRLGINRVIGQWLAKSGAIPQELAGRPIGDLPMNRLPDMLRQSGLPADYQKTLTQQINASINAGSGSIAGQQTVGEVLAHAISQTISEAVAFLLIFYAIGVAAALLGGIFQQTLGRLPLLWGVNRLGGATFGFLQGVVGVAIMLGILSPLAGFFHQQVLEAALARSVLAPFFLNLYRLMLV